jgi:alanyl-tRNA synthetase
MTVAELRDKYLRFFESKEHLRFPSGSLVPYDVTGKLDESLLFNGAGMIQFKPYFYGSAQPEHPRLTTAQKCVRTGDIEEVGDLSHLTFFEMMGNFSFGDYFIPQAIAFSWEFITGAEWLGLDPSRVAFTVYETDDVAYDEWSKWLLGAGLNPTDHIFRLGEETNFWPAGAYSKGPPGPCGPNTEMFYWVDPSEKRPSPYTREDFLRDDAESKWLEFWNDVFIQYDWRGHHRTPGKPADGYIKDEIASLPFQSVDTGMGLERTATVLGGYKSIYDTDAFQPILAAISGLAAVAYGSDETKDRAMRIVADHLRTSCFCLADGVLPGNSGRGYVLRRLIRRAVLKGFRTLGLEKPFMSTLVTPIVATLGGFWTELAERQETLEEILGNEEALFRRTLERGVDLLAEQLAKLGKGKELPGAEAFDLYETFGFPLEVTKEICAEQGVAVDIDGYEVALAEAQKRSRAGQERQTVYGGTEGDPFLKLPATRFLGYDRLSSAATVLDSREVDGRLEVAFDQTPFYAASGGQISDVGSVAFGTVSAEVVGVAKRGGVFVHTLKPHGSLEELHKAVEAGTVTATVTESQRRQTVRNHTATHLLHAALRGRLGTHVTQAGSYVGPDRLRFDFTHGKAISREELAEIERTVNLEILNNTAVHTYVDLPIEEAKSMGAMALFGEKYGNKVRMVEVGDFSRELCGGTHVRAIGEIGLFKIVSESSAASGVRRIEAITGEAAYGLTVEEEGRLREAASLLKSTPKDLVHAIEKALEAQRELKQKLEKARSGGAATSEATVTDLGAVELATEILREGEQADATRLADQLSEGQPRRVVVVALVGNEKVLFVAKAGADAQKSGAHAGNLVKALAKITGGGGGGGPAFATAGGQQVGLVDDAIAAAAQLVKEMLG